MFDLLIKTLYKIQFLNMSKSIDIQLHSIKLKADFYPCELKDGRATLNIPDNPNIEFVVMHLDKNGNAHEDIAVDMKKYKV